MHRDPERLPSQDPPRRAVARRVVVVLIGAAGLAAVVGGWLIVRLFIGDTKPEFAEPNHIEAVFDYPDNGGQPWGGRFDASVDRESATIFVIYEDGRTGDATLRIGETATISGVTVTLCGTWVAPPRFKFTLDSGTDFDSLSIAYIVQSIDGTAPVCPERVK